jgi:hypothetical protein
MSAPAQKCEAHPARQAQRWILAQAAGQAGTSRPLQPDSIDLPWLNDYPEQLVWPQVQTISVLSAIPSQWALQYFEPLGAMQLQAAFAHFLELAIVFLHPVRHTSFADVPVPNSMQDFYAMIVRSVNRSPLPRSGLAAYQCKPSLACYDFLVGIGKRTPTNTMCRPGHYLSVRFGILFLPLLFAGCSSPRPSSANAVKDHSGPVQGPNTIVCWGDSMTEGGEGSTDIGSYPSLLQADLGPQVVNMGIGGQTSTQIGVRQGGVPSYINVAGGTIPAQGGVIVTFATGYEPLTRPTGTIQGSIQGVEGTLSLSGVLPAATFTFTPVPGSQLPVTISGTPRFTPDTPYQIYLPIFWEGRNNLFPTTAGPWGPARIESDLAAQVASLPQGLNYLVLPVLNENYAAERKGGANYPTVISLNNALAATYGTHFLDIRSLLVNSYNPASPIDVTDFQSDMPPTSLGAVSGQGTLAGSIGLTDTTFTLNIASGSLIAYRNLVIDDENIRILAINGSTVTDCIRGYGGIQASHAAGAAVTERDPTHLNLQGYTIVANAIAQKLASM